MAIKGLVVLGVEGARAHDLQQKSWQKAGPDTSCVTQGKPLPLRCLLQL